MTEQETLQVLRLLQAAYPQYYKNLSKNKADEVLNLWSSMFAEDEVKPVLLAIKTYIASDTTGFPPPIGKIKETMHFLTRPQTMSGSEAWNLVLKAMDKAYNKPAPAFNELPEDIRKIIGDWQTLDGYNRISIDSLNIAKNNFLREYNRLIQSNMSIDLLPTEAKQYRDMLLSENGTAETKRLCE